MALTRYVPLPEAARRLHMRATDLFHQVEIGKIQIAMITTPEGKILMNELDIQAQIPKEEQPEYKLHAHLKGIKIGMGEASRKYEVPISTLSGWVENGYIAILGITPVRGGMQTLVDEADVAYCSELRKLRPGAGKWLFSKDGSPYNPKTK